MNKEQENQLSRLTLEAVTRKARETTLEHGRHVPTMIVAGTQQVAVMQFDTFADTHNGRVNQMLNAGFALGRERLLGVPEQVFFITEGWMSVLEDQQEPTAAPSQAPNRKEVLIISNLDIRERASKGIILEMVRDDDDQLVELKPFDVDKEPGQMESPLIMAFVQGFVMGAGGQSDQLRSNEQDPTEGTETLKAACPAWPVRLFQRARPD